jgi:hypothetical protein
VTKVSHTSRPNISDSSRQDLFNDTNGVIIGVLVCLQSFFFISFFSLLFVICEEAREIKKKKDLEGTLKLR